MQACLTVYLTLDADGLGQEFVDQRQVEAVHLQRERVAPVRGDAAVHQQLLSPVADQEVVQPDVLAVE